MMRSVVLLLILALPVRGYELNTDKEVKLSARAWQSLTPFVQQTDFPELKLESVLKKKNTAIAFSGGGSRSYIAGLGSLSGLSSLDLIKNIRYIAGISGGSWVTSTFTYAQNIKDESTFLGPIVDPKDLTQKGLQEMDPSCARAFTEVSMVGIALKALNESIVSSLSDSWAYAVQKMYLDTVGIPSDSYFSWDSATVDEIVSRNPSLRRSDFILPANSDRPYPILGTTLIGPTDKSPYTVENRNYTMIEFTPIYSGHMKTIDVEYNPSHGLLRSVRRVGGAVESFAFARNGSSPTFGLVKDTAAGTLSVPKPLNTLNLGYAAAASSWAPGSFFDSLPNELPEKLGNMQFSYWSPADRTPSEEDTLFSDGGCYQNINLISFLQRRVEKIVLFFNSQTPLQPASKWDVYNDPPSQTQISDNLAAYFGVYPTDYAKWQNRSFSYEKNQVFDQSEWPVLVTALQAAQEAGKGIVATLNLTTVENQWWGIPSGITSQITVVYLGRLSGWEAQLSDEMRQLLVPSDPESAADLSQTVSDGPYRGFPHYFTSGGVINYERANALADLTGWVILQNAELFKSIFSH